VWDWERLNDIKAIWLRSTNEVEDEEYVKFYQALSKDSSEPTSYAHFKAEGDVEFKAILYIPDKPAPDYYDKYYSRSSALKLYVRRVFISDEFDELLPKYLGFIKGIVDSDTLPLNVSRETLQQHTSLKTIKKKLVRKALDMIRKLAEEGNDAEDDESSTGVSSDTSKYDKFWKAFGRSIKLGIIEDASNRTRLAKLIRFQTSKSDGQLVSLEQYVERMKDGQKNIYYITGESIDALKDSPFVEKLLAKDFEVIFFTDPVDEYMMQNLTEFDDFKFSNVSKEDLKFGDANDDDKKRFKKTKEAFKAFTSWWAGKIPAVMIENVKVSNRLSTTPCVVVSSKYGWSANMERIMKAQAMTDASMQEYMRGKRTLEINPRHPMIAALKQRFEADPDSQEAAQLALLMFETAMMESGFSFDKPGDYAGRVFDMLGASMGVAKDAELLDEEQFHAVPEEDEDIVREEEPAPKDEL
jgi:heat shock protein beta